MLGPNMYSYYNKSEKRFFPSMKNISISSTWRLDKVNFIQRKSALQNKQKTRKEILPFVTEYGPSMPDLKHILMNKWHLIQNQPLLRNTFKNPPLISYRKGRSLKDVLVRAKL